MTTVTESPLKARDGRAEGRSHPAIQTGGDVAPPLSPSELGIISRGIWGWGAPWQLDVPACSLIFLHLARCSVVSIPWPQWAPLLLWTTFSTLPGWHPPHSS